MVGAVGVVVYAVAEIAATARRFRFGVCLRRRLLLLLLLDVVVVLSFRVFLHQWIVVEGRSVHVG